MSLKSTLSLSNLTLLVALSLSTVAAYYSIIGLTTIFAGAVIPIIIMGSILEIGKITATVWLRKYWHRCGFVLKLYLVPAVVLLAFLTSMGIFGFLSKAHTDQNLVSGDVQAKIAIYDEKIKTSRENIDAARRALKQMDEAVEQVLGRSTTEQGAERSVQIRRQQSQERQRLIREIEAEQKTISRINEERAPIAAEIRKVEAEVGPIKYIAALIYGDDTNKNMLEAAVRWVIILLVIVFDPLAIALVLAANASKDWDKEIDEDPTLLYVADVGEKPTSEELEEIIRESNDPNKVDQMSENQTDSEGEPLEQQETVDKYAYLKVPFVHFTNLKPMVAKSVASNDNDKIEVEEKPAEKANKTMSDIKTSKEIATDGVTKENPVQDLNDGYVLYEGKHFSKQALKEIKPELFIARPDNISQVSTNFGTDFPKVANKGDMFVRVDMLPNRVFKFDGKRWIEINKANTDSYLYDQEYIKYLVNKISFGEYDIELLTDNEKSQIEEHLKNQNS